MGHEAIIYGRIEGMTWRTARYRELQDRNAAVLCQLPEADDWPFLVRGLFALPAPGIYGTYRNQVVHFGASFKDDPTGSDGWVIEWLAKFEGLLRRLYWLSAVVHVESEVGGHRTWRWAPTDAALALLAQDDPRPLGDWTREGPSANDA